MANIWQCLFWPLRLHTTTIIVHMATVDDTWQQYGKRNWPRQRLIFKWQYTSTQVVCCHITISVCCNNSQEKMDDGRDAGLPLLPDDGAALPFLPHDGWELPTSRSEARSRKNLCRENCRLFQQTRSHITDPWSWTRLGGPSFRVTLCQRSWIIYPVTGSIELLNSSSTSTWNRGMLRETSLHL